jgi:hypothetical protein
VHTSNGLFVLDDGGTGVAQYSGTNGIVPAPAGATTFSLIDLPAIGLVSSLKAVSASQQFQTYLMYKPLSSNSIWVTLETLSWNWAGAANKGQDGTWTLVGNASSFSANPTGVNSVALPLWNNYATNIP